jgi:hypothetical protein
VRPPAISGLDVGQSTDSQALAYAIVLHMLNLIPLIVVVFVLLHRLVRRDLADDAQVSGR